MKKRRISRAVIAVVGLCLPFAVGCAQASPSAPTPPPVLRVRHSIVGSVLARYSKTPIPNATVTIIDGPDAGTQTVTDHTGQFMVSADATFTLQASAPDFDTQRENIVPGQAQIQFQLEPTTLTFRWSGTFQLPRVAGDLTAIGVPPGGVVEFETHHTGLMTLTIDAGCSTSGTYDDFGTSVREQGSQLRVLRTFAHYSEGAKAVLPPGHYRLHVNTHNYYADLGCPWELELQRPS